LVLKEQEILIKSLLFRIVAVHLLTKNKGIKTPGIDGVTLDDNFK
jgi:hypothetical protein